MKTSEKITALLLAYVELAQNHYQHETQIIDALTDIFDESELREYGLSEFIEPYF